MSARPTTEADVSEWRDHVISDHIKDLRRSADMVEQSPHRDTFKGTIREFRAAADELEKVLQRAFPYFLPGTAVCTPALDPPPSAKFGCFYADGSVLWYNDDGRPIPVNLPLATQATPMTDAATWITERDEEVVDADFARRLERESQRIQANVSRLIKRSRRGRARRMLGRARSLNPTQFD